MGIKIWMTKIGLLLLPILLLMITGHPVSAKTIGVIMTADIPYYQDIHKEFTAGLDKDIEIVIQKPMPDPMSWTNAARKLVGIKASVIVCYGAPATLTTMKETGDIPILFAGVYDPDSMSIAGKNATGISATVPIDKILKDLSRITKLVKLGIIFSKSEKDTIVQARDLKKSEGAVGFQSVLISVGDKVNKDEIKGIDGLLLTSCGAGMLNINDIIDAARKNKVPTASLIGGGENSGVVLTIAADPKEQGAGLAEMVKKVLDGAKPSDIPIREPKRIQTIVNLKEAKSMGLNVPSSISGTASRVIE
jgi:putative ABC transport system substrate-binding protein